jgi:predicted DNA-binding transcriptional regulator AlpA
MEFNCPNCGEDIQLIGTAVIKREFGLGPSAIDTRRARGEFPEPVLDLTNRLLWIRKEVEAAMARETEAKIVDFVHQIEHSLSSLPEDEQEKVRQILAKELDGGTGN